MAASPGFAPEPPSVRDRRSPNYATKERSEANSPPLAAAGGNGVSDASAGGVDREDTEKIDGWCRLGKALSLSFEQRI